MSYWLSQFDLDDDFNSFELTSVKCLYFDLYTTYILGKCYAKANVA